MLVLTLLLVVLISKVKSISFFASWVLWGGNNSTLVALPMLMRALFKGTVMLKVPRSAPFWLRKLVASLIWGSTLDTLTWQAPLVKSILLQAMTERLLLKHLLDVNAFGAFGYPVGFAECCRSGYIVEIRNGIVASLPSDVFPGSYTRSWWCPYSY